VKHLFADNDYVQYEVRIFPLPVSQIPYDPREALRKLVETINGLTASDGAVKWKGTSTMKGRTKGALHTAVTKAVLT
jgi:hypothetical protein